MEKKITKDERKEIAKQLGRFGGLATFHKVGKKGMSEMGKKGSNNRWHKK